MANRAFTGQYNQAGALAPTVGPSSLSFRRAAAVGDLYVNSTGQFERYYYPHPYRYWIGVFQPVGVAAVARVGPVYFKGILPGTVQTRVKRTDAWLDPLRGSP